jgi:hypothetical protein
MRSDLRTQLASCSQPPLSGFAATLSAVARGGPAAHASIAVPVPASIAAMKKLLLLVVIVALATLATKKVRAP